MKTHVLNTFKRFSVSPKVYKIVEPQTFLQKQSTCIGYNSFYTVWKYLQKSAEYSRRKRNFAMRE